MFFSVKSILVPFCVLKCSLRSKTCNFTFVFMTVCTRIRFQRRVACKEDQRHLQTGQGDSSHLPQCVSDIHIAQNHLYFKMACTPFPKKKNSHLSNGPTCKVVRPMKNMELLFTRGLLSLKRYFQFKVVNLQCFVEKSIL